MLQVEKIGEREPKPFRVETHLIKTHLSHPSQQSLTLRFRRHVPVNTVTQSPDLPRQAPRPIQNRDAMAPPEQRFPVSTLPQRVQGQLDTAGNLKSRKLARDFDLKRDCKLMELVQYSCTPWQDMIALQLEGKQQQCWPVVRLFRR